MLRNVLIPIILLACLLAASCGGGSSIDRELSKKPAPECRIVSDADKVGCPAVVRCVITGDPDFDLLRYQWTWDVSGGEVTELSPDGTVAWISIDEPGVCMMSARGVDGKGNDCTTPRHKIRCARGLNAPPVITCEGPTDSPFEKQGGGQSLRYHDWRWRCLSYDPDDPSFSPRDVASSLEIGPDRNGDGELDRAVIAINSDGQMTIAPDIDGDGVDDDCDGSVLPTPDPWGITFSCTCPSKSKEDVYVWKVKMSSSSSKKEFKGHVTLLK